MNVVFVNFASEWGGGEGWTQRTAIGLQDKKHSILVVGRKNTPFSAKCRESGLKVREIPVSFDYNPKTVLRLRSLFKSFETDVVVVHHNKDVRLAGVAARLLGVSVLHRNGFPVIHDNLRHRFTSLFIDRILTNSSKIKNHYQKMVWLNKKPIDVVPNGIKLQDVALPSREQFWNNNQAKINPNSDMIALYLGRLTKVKQVDILVNAFSRLPHSSKWKMAIVGDGSEREALEEMVKTQNLEERIVFLGFRSDSAQLPAFADLVVLSSRDEGMPNSLMESMAHKTPVAASPAGDVEYLLDRGNAGWVMHNNTPGEWKDLLIKLEQEPECLTRVGDIGFSRIKEHFSFDKMIMGVEKSLSDTSRIPL